MSIADYEETLNIYSDIKRVGILGYEYLISKASRLIITSPEGLNTLLEMNEEELILFAQFFDEDFYTNDGFSVDIDKDSFTYFYDDGSGEIDIIIY